MPNTIESANRSSTRPARAMTRGRNSRTQQLLIVPTTQSRYSPSGSSTSGSTRMSLSSSTGSHADTNTTYTTGNNGDDNNQGANGQYGQLQQTALQQIALQQGQGHGDGHPMQHANLLDYTDQWAGTQLNYPPNLDHEDLTGPEQQQLYDEQPSHYDAQPSYFNGQPSQHNGQPSQYYGNYQNPSYAMARYPQQQADEEPFSPYYHRRST